jgi:hypothetical protein
MGREARAVRRYTHDLRDAYIERERPRTAPEPEPDDDRRRANPGRPYDDAARPDYESADDFDLDLDGDYDLRAAQRYADEMSRVLDRDELEPQ